MSSDIELSPKMLDLLRATFKRDDTVILGDIERHLLRRQDAPRDMSQLHPSEISKGDWCARKNYYQITLPEMDEPEEISSQLQMVFEAGHGIHAKYQLWLQEMGILWGRFRCVRCHNDVVEQSCDLDVCGVCGGFDWEYREVPLRMPSHALIGHTDGVLILPEDRIAMLEVKSVGLGTVRMLRPNLFDDYSRGDITLTQLWGRIKRPFAAHLRQGMLYIAMAKAWNEVWGSWVMPQIDEIIFIYEWKPTQAVREFVIPFQPHLIERQLIFAREVAHSLEVGQPPIRPDWVGAAGPDHRTCAKCSYRNLCWSIDAVTTTAPEPTPIAVVKSPLAKRKKAMGLGKT